MHSPLLARRPLRIEPQYYHIPEYVETFGPEVADLCARAGYAPDPEQELILDVVFAIRAGDAMPAAFTADIVGPRQNFKTGVLKMIDLGWLFITKDRLIVHSAHELDTTQETFRDIATLIEDNPFLSRQLKPTRGPRQGITDGNGRWMIELTGDRRLRFKARTNSGARGLTAAKLTLDEFFAVNKAMVGALFPTVLAIPGAQIVSASSAGKEESDALRDKRDRGRAGRTKNQFYIEYADPRGPTNDQPNPGCVNPRCKHEKTADGCALDDETRWKQIMPALGDRITVERVRSLRQEMPPEEFARELMVWWEDPPDDEDVGPFGPHWKRQAIKDAKMPKPRCLALAVSPSGHSSIAAVGDYGDDETKVIFPATSSKKKAKGGNRPGRTWVVPEAVKLAKKRGLRVAVAKYGPGKDLVPELVELLGEENVIIADMEALKDAYASLYDGITESHSVFHDGSKEMNDAARRVVKRMSAGRFLLGGKKEDEDGSMIEAGALALWGSEQPEAEAVMEPWFSMGLGDDE